MNTLKKANLILEEAIEKQDKQLLNEAIRLLNQWLHRNEDSKESRKN